MVKILQTYVSDDEEQDIVGEAHYQKELLKIVGGAKLEEGFNHTCNALLIHEDDNQYDRKAVAVVIDQMIVGYLPSDDTDEFHDAMDYYKADLAVVEAEIRGGWKRQDSEGHLGVVLHLAWPPKGKVTER